MMNSKATNIVLFLTAIIIPIIFLFHMVFNASMLNEASGFFFVDRIFGLIPYIVCIVLGAIVLSSRKETINKILVLFRCVLYGQIIILSIVILTQNINSFKASYKIVPIVYAVICFLLIVLELIRIVSLIKSYSDYDVSIGNVDLKGSKAYKIILVCVIVYFVILILTVLIEFVPGALISIIMFVVISLVVGGFFLAPKSSSTENGSTNNTPVANVEQNYSRYEENWKREEERLQEEERKFEEDQRIKNKKREIENEIRDLKADIEENKKAIDSYYRKDFGTLFINPEVCEEKIKEDNKRIKELEGELETLKKTK